MCMGGVLKMWQSTSGSTFEECGRLIFGRNLQEAFELTTIGKKHLFLVIGGYDSKIHCYTCLRTPYQPAEKDLHKHFTYKFSLTGHKDSVKDFSFTKQYFEFPNEIQYLASCSQDHNIRLWKLQPLSNVQSKTEAEGDQIEQTI